jgi:hypothetical protein
LGYKNSRYVEKEKAHGAVKEVAGYDTLFVRFYMKFHTLALL